MRGHQPSHSKLLSKARMLTGHPPLSAQTLGACHKQIRLSQLLTHHPSCLLQPCASSCSRRRGGIRPYHPAGCASPHASPPACPWAAAAATRRSAAGQGRAEGRAVVSGQKGAAGARRGRRLGQARYTDCQLCPFPTCPARQTAVAERVVNPSNTTAPTHSSSGSSRQHPPAGLPRP